jgi:hypothetical protein
VRRRVALTDEAAREARAADALARIKADPGDLDAAAVLDELRPDGYYRLRITEPRFTDTLRRLWCPPDLDALRPVADLAALRARRNADAPT